MSTADAMTAADLLSLLQGTVVTVALSVSGIAIGVPAGLALALLLWRRVPLLRHIIPLYVSIIRATPLVTLGLLIYFALPAMGLQIGPVTAAVVTLAINTTAFNCEIWRAGLIDFPRDQIESAQAFGMSWPHIVWRIMLPQVVRTCLPALVNEMTLLLKGSPAIAVIGIVDVTRAAVRIGANTYEPLPPFLVATAIYAGIVFVFVRMQRWLEAFSLRDEAET